MLEMRVKKADRKGTSFADLVWKPVVFCLAAQEETTIFFKPSGRDFVSGWPSPPDTSSAIESLYKGRCLRCTCHSI
jgi:hypothetical protein